MIFPPEGRSELQEEDDADDHCGILCLVKCKATHLLNVFNDFLCTTEETSLCVLIVHVCTF